MTGQPLLTPGQLELAYTDLRYALDVRPRGYAALGQVKGHVEALTAENCSLRADVENLRSTLTAVTGGWQPPEQLQVVVTVRPGQVEVCTDRSMPVLVTASYPIVEG